MITHYAGQAVDDGVEHLTGGEDDFNRGCEADQHAGDQHFFHAVDERVCSGTGAKTGDDGEGDAQQQIERRKLVVLPLPAG
ncbi:hypothetical protein D3C87_1630350 [compost metagenome]